MDRIEPEAFRFFCPLFADELVRREPLEGLVPFGLGNRGRAWTALPGRLPGARLRQQRGRQTVPNQPLKQLSVALQVRDCFGSAGEALSKAPGP